MIDAELRAIWGVWEPISEFLSDDEKPTLERCDEFHKWWKENHEGEEERLTDAEWITAYHYLCNYDVKVVLRDWALSENHIGGDDVLYFIQKTIEVMKEGYEIHTWYGEKTEVLVIGVKMKPEEALATKSDAIKSFCEKEGMEYTELPFAKSDE